MSDQQLITALMFFVGFILGVIVGVTLCIEVLNRNRRAVEQASIARKNRAGKVSQ